MPEYINREDVREMMRMEFTDEYADNTVDRLPTADVAEVRHARWVKDKTKGWICTNCGIGAPWDYTGHKYCHTCGAKWMEGAENA